jgi:hypothetical protein
MFAPPDKTVEGKSCLLLGRSPVEPGMCELWYVEIRSLFDGSDPVEPRKVNFHSSLLKLPLKFLHLAQDFPETISLGESSCLLQIPGDVPKSDFGVSFKMGHHEFA